jgi:hypothetical protein
MMLSRFRAVLLLVTALALAFTAFAQTTTTTGEINGTVGDNSGTLLPGVTVTVLNKDTGLTRTVYTENDGAYRVSILPPGMYSVTAELAGLGTVQRDNVRVPLGQAANVHLQLNPQVSEEITVTAAAPVVDTTQTAAQEEVTEEQIENLPILGRDFKDLVKLTPGVADAFGGRVAMVGARGTATDFNIDGANANSDFFAEERGGTAAPYVFSQAAIATFQVIRTTYSAEYSRGGGGTMNAITKSGTNELNGEVFYFLRDKDWASLRTVNGAEESFDARDVDQYGFAAGGPIIRDRLFFFVNTDFQDIEETLNTQDIRNNATFIALPADQRSAFITRIEGLLGQSLDSQFSYPTLENQDTYLGKIDWNIGASNHFNVRWNRSDFNNFPSENAGTLSNNGDEYNTVDSYVGQLDTILSGNMYNFALAQYSLEERPINALNTSLPSTGIRVGTTTFTFGQRDFLSNGTDEEKFEFKDTFSWMLGDHQIRAGGNYLTIDISNLFVRDRNGDFVFNSVADFLANRPATFEQGLGAPGSTGATVFDYSQWGAFIMDTWKPIAQLTLDFGLRYDAQETPVPSRNIYEATQPMLDDWFRDDTNNFAPRLGFAYDLFGTGRSVIRGGVGKYYNFLPGILYANPIQQISGLFTNYRFTCNAAGTNCPTYPNIFTPQQLQNASSLPVVDIATVSPQVEAAESWRGSLGYEQELWRGYSFEVEGIYAKHEKQQRFANVNAVPTGLVFGDLVQYNVSNPGRRFPQFNNVRMHVSDAEGEYTAATVALRKIALNSRLSWLAHYTWSESIDQDTNSRSTSTSFHYDPYDPEKSEGPSDNDVEHRIVGSATYELPYGFMISGIFNWRTGQPYTRNIFAGTSSSVNPLIGFSGVGVNVPVFVDSNGNVIDLTQASGSSPTEFANFLNSRGARIIGRNTENQPDFSNLDMRLSKRFGLPKGFEVEIIGEVFNVFNEANAFITATNQSEFNMTTTGTGANQRYNFTRNANFQVENGLDFNSPPRQYQAAVKFHF